MPTLVATMAAPVKMLSSRGSPQSAQIPHPAKKGTMTPATATSNAVPPTFINSEALTSSPTRKSRNITPRSESVRRNSLGASQPSTCGPIRTPARISPTMPGCPRRSKISARSLADAKTRSIASGIWAADGMSPLSGTTRARRNVRPSASARIGAANNGVEVGWSAPASFSSVTATASVFSAEPRWMCIALPSGADWNMPAAFALPSLMIHIS